MREENVKGTCEDCFTEHLKSRLRTARHRNRELSVKLIIYRCLTILFLIALTILIICLVSSNRKLKSMESEIGNFRMPATTINYATPLYSETINLNAEYVVAEISEATVVTDEYYFLQDYDIVDIFDNMTATAYDLSVQSCGKTMNDTGYGITAYGADISGLSWSEARCIAVDRNLIPLGSTVYIEFFDEQYTQYNGIYMALDTGSAIVGNKIDFFMGDFSSESPSQETIDFGVTNCKILVLGVNNNNG